VFIRATPNRKGNSDILESKFPLDSSPDRINKCFADLRFSESLRFVLFLRMRCIGEKFSLFFIFSMYIRFKLVSLNLLEAVHSRL
jgi:hypothetical protein